MATKSYPGPPIATMFIPTIETKLLSFNLKNSTTAVVQRAADWCIAAGVDILETALPMTPWDSGKLRESGTVSVFLGTKKIDVASGTKEGQVRTLSGMASITPRLTRKLARRGKARVNAVVHYHRLTDSNEGPRNIAVWTHENLNPYGSGAAPQARKPGTGPKYLQRAVKEREGYWNMQARRIKGLVTSDIKSMGQVTAGALKGPTVVGKIKLQLNRLKKFVFLKRR